LIVDDGKPNRDLAALMLKRVGLTYEMATNGVEALEKIAGEPLSKEEQLEQLRQLKAQTGL